MRSSTSAPTASTWVYDIQEGGRTRIATIAFEGNTAFSDGRLREVITTKRSHILSWLTRNDIYGRRSPARR